MSKTKKSKSGLANQRSRAAKRQTSPSINTDKSLKNAPRASSPISVLAAHTNAGVTKSRNRKKVSRNQRLRQEKGVARAEAVLDHLEKKVERSAKRQRQRKARKGNWDDINGTGQEERRKAVLGDAETGDPEDEWEDEDEADEISKSNDGVEVLATTTKAKLVIADLDSPVEETAEEDKIT